MVGSPRRCSDAAPAGTPVLTDPGVLAPADPGDPGVTSVEQVLRGQGDPGGAVHVDPGVLGLGGVPRPTERDERRPPGLEPGSLGVAEVGVGDHERVDGGGAQELVVPRDRVVALAGEQQDVVAGRSGGLDQGVHEAVHGGVGCALLRRREAQADQVGGAGAQVAGGAVGRVAEVVDRGLHPLQRRRAQQLGVVHRVGDGLARHAGALGDVGQGRRLTHRNRWDGTVGPRHGTPLIVPIQDTARCRWRAS